MLAVHAVPRVRKTVDLNITKGASTLGQRNVNASEHLSQGLRGMWAHEHKAEMACNEMAVRL